MHARVVFCTLGFWAEGDDLRRRSTRKGLRVPPQDESSNTIILEVSLVQLLRVFVLSLAGHQQAEKVGDRRHALGGACSPLHAWFVGGGKTTCDVDQRARDCAFHLGLESALKCCSTHGREFDQEIFAFDSIAEGDVEFGHDAVHRSIDGRLHFHRFHQEEFVALNHFRTNRNRQ